MGDKYQLRINLSFKIAMNVVYNTEQWYSLIYCKSLAKLGKM